MGGVCGDILIKTDESQPKRLPRTEWSETDVITVAAPDLRNTSFAEDEFGKVMGRRIRRILTVASNNGVENLILGAFGCGAFQNPPKTIARLFQTELNPFMHSFKRIEFPIMGFNQNDPNYEAFTHIFG